ncbi:MAG: hypothetical protein GWN73_12755, partial [Actinobacteria bacterium]|nr:hypothetical protein [Actinomycetota bacterium]NIU66235.1 hypothetical protein [Actinomycetota bacterium]NIW28052.1 hypothetical protein [Actinomycetota bacterium]
MVLGEQPYRVDRFWGELPDGFELGLVSTVAVAPGGEVVVARRNPSSVLVLGPDGTLGCVFGAGTLSDPHGVNVTATGRILAVDRDAHEVLVFSLEGEVLMRLGERDRPRDDAPFNHPTSAAMAADGEIYV